MSILGGLLFQPETSSTVLTEIITKTTSNILTSSSNSSGQNNTATANINISDIKAGPNCSIDISTSQKVIQTPNFSGLSDETQSSAIKSAIKGALDTKIKETQRGVQFMSNPTNSETVNRTVDDIATNVSQMSIVSCLQKNTASADLNISNIQSNCPAICGRENLTFTQFFTVQDFNKLCTTPVNGTQEIVQAAVASCISKNKQVTDSIAELARILTVDAANETVGLDPEGLVAATGSAASKVVDSSGNAASGIIDSASTMIIVIAVVGLIVGAVFLYFFLQTPQGQQMSSNYM